MLHIARLAISILLIAYLHTVRADELMTQGSSINQEIASIVESKRNPYLKLSEFPNRADDLKSLYAMSGYQLLWLNQEYSEKNIEDGLNVLSGAASHGLNPDNYDIGVLKSKFPGILVTSSYKDMALYDTALSIAMLRFVHDLHYGRVNPRDVKFNLKPRDKSLIDLPTLLKNSLAQGEITKLPSLVEPKSKQYQKLKQALANHNQLAVQDKPYKWLAKKNLTPGDHSAEIAGLRQFLIALGDIPEYVVANEGFYDNILADGVKKFQSRYGLTANGIIDKQTAAAINEPIKQRVTQIELSMERLRWLPEPSEGASIFVNIPAFQLHAFNAIDQDIADAVHMKVVVGKASDHQTPILMSDMKYVDFMPYWNVPTSIVKKEILPKLSRNSSYLDRENMELISSSGNAEDPVFIEDTISLLKQGKLRIRQRSGGKNALGKVKFMFPNKYNVYLHDTQSKSFFARSRRDFSHGCVRVAEPQSLAEFVLKDNKGWDSESIHKSMNASKSRQVTLTKPIPVLIFYATAYFDHDDNLTFYSDIYGHDALLLAALSKRSDLSDDSIFNAKEETERPADLEELGV